VKREDYEPFCEVVVGFAELKGKQLSAPAIELYWHAMQHWPIEDFRSAAQQLLRTCEFMPVPKDFEDLRRAGDLTAGEAWDAVYLGRGIATDRAWRAAEIAANGRRLGMLDMEREIPHVQRRFLEIYRELTDVEETREYVPQLTARTHDGLKKLGHH
jgi:hypothetical protein